MRAAGVMLRSFVIALAFAGAHGFSVAPNLHALSRGDAASARSSVNSRGNSRPRIGVVGLSGVSMQADGEGEAQSQLNSAAAMCGAGLGPSFLDQQRELVSLHFRVAPCLCLFL